MYIHVVFKNSNMTMDVNFSDPEVARGAFNNMCEAMSRKVDKIWSNNDHMIDMSTVASIHLFRKLPY